MTQRALLLLFVTLAPLAACTTDEDPLPVERATARPSLSSVPRDAFNHIAVELALPLMWRVDADGDGLLDADELAVLEQPPYVSWSTYVDEGGLTPTFFSAFDDIARVHRDGMRTKSRDTGARERFAANLEELRQGRPTIVFTDVTGMTKGERAFVEKMVLVARRIEDLYARQQGFFGLAREIPDDDTLGRAIFHRNQGPFCVAPKTEKDPWCGALAKAPPRTSGLYPADIQSDPTFCDMLAAREDQAALLDPFVVVVADRDATLRAVSYHEAYQDEMAQIATLLDEARAVLDVEDEDALRAYLAAAAHAFRTDDWGAADEAWSRMNVRNSRWYLRVGPDEVYFEPCARKAGFHLSFARINQESIAWQTKLDPLKGEMERALAALAGPPYVARDVRFALPDFIDVVLNAGDSRDAHGATIGQSLPNWGAVASEGRGRTVAMTNLYTDDDSRAALDEQAQSLFCADTAARFDTDKAPAVLSTVLHEAAHNLGPSHDYRVDGKTDEELFGGPLASTLEELKAQTAALWFTDWLAARGVVDGDLARRAHVRDVAWMFGHIARGMVTPEGRPRAYSQLSATQLGFLMDEGAIVWRRDERAANGTDQGCFALVEAKLAPAIETLARTVFSIKGSGDKARATALLARYVSVEPDDGHPHAIVTERWQRAERASFVYAIKR